VWFQGETRIGQTGRTCRRWYEKGVRPRGPRDLHHEALYLFGAVCPAREEAVALALPVVSTAAMQAMLDNLTLAFLPPYSPELNVIERVWLHLKERYLSHRVWPDYDDILDAVCEAWNRLIDEPGRIKSRTDADWLASVRI